MFWNEAIINFVDPIYRNIIYETERYGAVVIGACIA